MMQGLKKGSFIALTAVLIFSLLSVAPLRGQAKGVCCVAGNYAGSNINYAKPNCPPPVKENFTMLIKQMTPCATTIGGTITDSSGTVNNWTGTLSRGLRGCCLLEGSSITPSGNTVRFKGTICPRLGKWRIKGTWEESGSTDPCRGSGTWEATQT